MKNIFNKIHLHPFYYFFLFIIILTAQIHSFFSFSVIILVHELGHIIMAFLFKWEISKIVILPYGMITFFKNNLTKPIYQEFLILIMGPLFQVLFNIYFKCPYSNFLLFINLLPIYPLDGSKIFFLLCNKTISYYHSYLLTFFLSFLTIIYVLFYYQNLLIILMLLYLFIHLFSYLNDLDNTLLAFCYERFKYHFFSSKKKYLNKVNLKAMYRAKYHYFNVNNKFVKEEEIFLKMFDK